jgi:hypothetical protein
MEDKELRQLLADIIEVLAELTDDVTNLKASRPTDTKIIQETERVEREERIRTGAARPPKPRTVVEKVSSLRERVKSLRT